MAEGEGEDARRWGTRDCAAHAMREKERKRKREREREARETTKQEGNTS